MLPPAGGDDIFTFFVTSLDCGGGACCTFTPSFQKHGWVIGVPPARALELPLQLRWWRLAGFELIVVLRCHKGPDRLPWYPASFIKAFTLSESCTLYPGFSGLHCSVPFG